MPGMKLQFLRNAAQRAATGKRLPTRPLEAVLIYGDAAQRAVAVRRIIEQAPQLTHNKATYHILLTFCDVCDNTARCELLFNVRRQLVDLSRIQPGNYIVQKLIEVVPAVQKREMAESFIEEFSDVCRHPVGAHVIQKFMEYPVSQEVLEEVLLKNAMMLACHPHGQYVIAKCVERDSGSPTAKKLIDCLMQGDAASCALKEKELTNAIVVGSLLKSTSVSDDAKNSILEALISNFEACLKSEKNYVALAAAMATALSRPRTKTCKQFIDLVTKHMPALLASKPLVHVAVEAVRFSPKHRDAILAQLLSEHTIEEIAMNSMSTLVLRAAIESSPDALPATAMDTLTTKALELSQNPAGSPVIQKLLGCSGSTETATKVAASLQGHVRELALHESGSHVIQALLESAAFDTPAGSSIFAELCGDSSAASFDELARNMFGCRVLQKAIAYAPLEWLKRVAESLESTVFDLSMDRCGCFVVQSLLKQLKQQNEEESRKKIMDALKLHVYDLSMCPWGGRVVLDTMLVVGSDKLRDAIRNVIFLKAERFLSEEPPKLDATGEKRAFKQPHTKRKRDEK